MEFDPRLEAYKNTNFNSYTTGLGAKLQECSANGEVKVVKLHVSRVPKSMNMMELENLFSQCGNPTNIYMKKGSNIHFSEAFIEYSKLSEAEAAIRRFDNKDPYNLKVDVAETERPERQTVPVFNEEMAIATQQQVAESTDSEAPALPIVPFLCNLVRNMSGYPYPGALGRMFEPSISVSNNRKVSGGRVYCIRPAENLSKIRKSHRKFDEIIQDNLDALTFTRERIFFESGVEPALPDNFEKRTCAVCGVLNSFVCNGCKGVSYCCPDCQDKDWPQHKLVCGKGAIRTSGMDAIQRNGMPVDGSTSDMGLDKMESDKKSDKSFTHQTGLRKPVESNMYLRPADRKSFNKNYNQNKPHNDSSPNFSKNSSGFKKSSTNEIDTKSKFSDNKSGFKKTITNENTTKYNEARSSYNDVGFKKTITHDSQLSTTPASPPKISNQNKVEVPQMQPKVQVKRIEAGAVKKACLAHADSLNDYWINLQDDVSALEALGLELNKRITASSPGLKNAVVGDWCCKQYDGVWTRARVVSAGPHQQEIIYVDYGNCESATLDQLKVLPADLAAEPPFAIHVLHPEGLEMADTLAPIQVCFLSEDADGRWTVEKYNETRSSNASLKKTITHDSHPSTMPASPPKISNQNKVEVSQMQPKVQVKRIEAGTVKKVCLAHADSLNDYWINLQDEVSALEALGLELNKRITDSSPGLKNAVVGDWCCKQYDGVWTRARVVSAGPHQQEIIYVDYGNCESATLDQLKVLPSDFAAEPPFAIHVLHPEGLEMADPLAPIQVRFLSEDADGRWTVEKAQTNVSPEVVSQPKVPHVAKYNSGKQSNIEKSVPVRDIKSPVTPQTSRYFKEDEVYEVILQDFISLNEIYVTKVDVIGDLEKLHAELNSMVSDSSQQLTNVAEKSKCAAKFNGEWFRAQVLKLEPLTVLYVDYGNEATCKPADVKVLPDKFKVGLLTTKVRLTSPPTKEQLLALNSAPVKLYVIKKDGSFWLAEFASAEQLKSNPGTAEQKVSTPVNDPSIITRVTAEQPKFRAEPNPDLSLLSNNFEENSSLVNYKRIIDIPKEQQSAYCEATEVLSENLFTCIMASDDFGKQDSQTIIEMDLGDLLESPYQPNVFESWRSSENGSPRFENVRPTEPQMKEMVGVYCKNIAPFWRRGVVLSEMNGSYSVALVDHGQLVISNNLKKLPDEYKKCPLMAVKLNLKSCSPVRIRKGDVFCVTLQKYSSDVREWEVSVNLLHETPFQLGVGRLSDWKIEPDQVHQLATVTMESGGRVTITAFHDVRTIYVRPITADYLKLYECLSQEVAAECIKADCLDRDPLVGELVAAKWNQDGNHYRAQILGKTNKKGTYRVVFVDYGNFDNIHTSMMKSLSNKLKAEPCCAVKVGLRDVGAKTLTPAAFQYGIKLIEAEELLSIEFEDLEEVQLTKLTDNTNISEKISELLEPSWMREPHFNTSLALQKFPMAQDLPKPNREDILQIGKREKILVTYVPPWVAKNDDKIQLVVCKASEKLLVVYNKVLANQIKEYVASQTAGQSYVPRKGELCICIAADDSLTRAECVSILNGEKALVADIDYGCQMEVSFKKIYKMPRDLMQLPAFAVYCYAEGLPSTVTYEKLIVAQSALDICEAEIRSFGNEHYTICIPELNARVSAM